ncbi:ribosomal protein [Anaerostipes sp. 494a]|uniref:ribosomal-processing cysteine protease Prp n=1 Tax=Anaerostipes TaxID=207244 RepID=UPI000950DBF0|nr:MULTISPECIES: ribosomal-processing cysteine protease Prp [Anaerostipes]MCI5624232.1 ribosomal-processing cysteine protease Prp [Anaerostipes sp.]MDY2726870.1 ribosomal-processing cysteine protease Prp [Anaerostipes faecalis]OLR58687.1 ribosomal protein [Anaerostipes sp. 494a]
MTKITFYQSEDGSFSGFDSQDHAGYDVEGQDIVCSAVSALVINFVNSLDQFTDDNYQVDVDQENARINVVFTEKLSAEGSLLLNSLILGLSGIEEEQEQYLDVIFKEV